MWGSFGLLAASGVVAGTLGLKLAVRWTGARIELWRALVSASGSVVVLFAGFIGALQVGLESWWLFVVGLAGWLFLTYYLVLRSAPPSSLGRTIGRTLATAVCVFVGTSTMAALLYSGSPGIWSRSLQQRSMADIRSVGTDLLRWSSDNLDLVSAPTVQNVSTGEAPTSEIGAAVAAQEPQSAPAAEIFRWGQLPEIGGEELTALLTKREGGYSAYQNSVPTRDGWGHPYQVLFEPRLQEHMVAIRSLGADGEPDGDVYVVGPFPPTETDRDIVWADGRFVRWPDLPGVESRELYSKLTDPHELWIVREILDHERPRRGHWVLQDETTLRAPIEPLELREWKERNRRELRFGLEDADAEVVDRLVDRLVEANRKPVAHRYPSDPARGYLVDRDGVFAGYFPRVDLFSDEPIDESAGGWVRLRQEHPQVLGLLSVSAPAYDRASRLALVYVARELNATKGSGLLILYRVERGVAKQLGSVMVWLS